jgi:uncharacterized membrane protein
VGVTLAMLAAIGWGSGDFLSGIAAKKDHFLTITMCREMLQLVVIFGYLALVPATLHLSDLALTFIPGLLVGVALPTFFRALASGRMAVVAPVAGTTAAIVPVVMGLVSGDRPSLVQLCGLLIAVLAVALVSVVLDEQSTGRKRTINGRDVLLGAACGLAFGSYLAFMDHTSDDSGLWPLIGVKIGLFVSSTVWALSHRGPVTFPRRAWRYWVAGSVCDVSGSIAYLYAIRADLLSVTAAVASLFPVVTAVLAWAFLRERMSRVNLTGLGLAGVSLALIAGG